MTVRAPRFERVEGEPLVELPPFDVAATRVESLLAGEARTWVVVPALNEASMIRATLDALGAQSLRPLVVCVVDNGSSDGTQDVVRAWAVAMAARPAGSTPPPGLRLAYEREKGTGAAADTGMRVAIAAGASLLLRTDADTLPRRDWAVRLVARLDEGNDLVAGRVVDRDDEGTGWARRLALAALITATAAISVPRNRGPRYRTRFRMLVGSNVGIRATTYVEAGGFPRAAIEEVHDDRALMNRVRRVSDRITSEHGAVVATSIRRYRRYGTLGIIRWYLRHETDGAPVDVR